MLPPSPFSEAFGFYIAGSHGFRSFDILSQYQGNIAIGRQILGTELGKLRERSVPLAQ
jgi:hypothetical protein